jgi:hypothetical protein
MGHSNAREASSTVPARLVGWLHASGSARCGNTEYWVQIDGTLDWTNKNSLAGFHDDLRQNGTCLQDQRFNAKSANCGTSLVSYVFGYHPQPADA